MIRKFNLLFVVLFMSFCFMNFMCSCSSGTSTDTSESISNDSLAYIMGELVGERYHNEYSNFKYHEDTVDLSKVAEEFDAVNRLCSNKGFLEGLRVYYFTQTIGQMFHEERNFDISPSKLRKFTMTYLEDSSHFLLREDMPDSDFIRNCINDNDTTTIYKVFGGYVAGSIDNIMKEKSIVFTDCKNEIFKGISYSEETEVKQPAIDAFCEYIAILAVLELSDLNVDEKFSQQIAANAFKKTLIDGVVNSKTEKKQLLHNALKELLQDYYELDRSAILSIIE